MRTSHLPIVVLIALAGPACSRAPAAADVPQNPGAPPELVAPILAAPAPTVPADALTDEPEAEVPEADAATATVDAVPAAPSPVPVPPTSCSADSDCGWNNPCAPTYCGPAGGTVTSDCDESMPPRGECRCLDRVCTMKRFDPATGDSQEIVLPGQEQCTVDLGAGRCHAGPARAAETRGPITVEGPYCEWDPELRSCRFFWAERVPCTSFRTCGWEWSGGRLHPVRATEPRERPRRPCEDGEFDSVCSGDPGDGVCTIVSWPC